MNIFYGFFSSKKSENMFQNAPFKKISPGKHAPEPP